MLRSTPERARAAFTLVEVMVVVVILGLVGGVAVSAWVSMLPNQQFNSAVRNLSEVLHETRSNAIAQNREYRIEYHLEDDTYRVWTPFRTGGGFATAEDDPARLYVKETDLGARGIDLERVVVDDRVFDSGATPVVVYFKPLGASNYHTVLLRQVQFDRLFTLELLPLTGEIRLHDGEFEREPVDEGDFR